MSLVALGTQCIHLNIIHSKECQDPLKAGRQDEAEVTGGIKIFQSIWVAVSVQLDGTEGHD